MNVKRPGLLLLTATLALAAPKRSAFAAADEVSPVVKINEAAAKAEIQVERLRGGLSVLSGSGGNIVVLAGPDGKLLVDAGIALSRPRLQAALQRISPAPPRYVINTHWHWDHTDGNTWLHEAGATIVAHPNVLRRVSRTERVEDWRFTFQPLPVAGRPTQLVEGERTLDFAGSKVVLRSRGLGHTDGDLSVYFAKADVLALGDMFWNGVYPFIDNGVGGGIDPMIAWLDAALPQVGANTLVVPGHGPVGNRAQLVEYRDMLVAIRNNVAALKKQGKSLEQVLAAKPTAAYDAKWGQFVIGPAFFTQLVYDGL
jgi:glyoxylase-like metal-dependent hydrolase (beta-lactamase superfamily II)